MNTTPNSVVAETSSNSTKLMSLLALASGAVAIPQTGQADIIYYDLTSSPAEVGFGGNSVFQFTVPGSANVGFTRDTRVEYTYINSRFVSYRSVIAGNLGGGADAGVRGLGNGFVVPLGLGAAWDQGVGTLASAAVGVENEDGIRTPASGYSNQYLAWMFADSTQGDALRYGWVEISLSYENDGPLVTIFRYAYDDSGAKPTMGAVPEPSSSALLAIGAMALGARGLRKWREKRQTVSQN